MFSSKQQNETIPRIEKYTITETQRHQQNPSKAIRHIMTKFVLPLIREKETTYIVKQYFGKTSSHL